MIKVKLLLLLHLLVTINADKKCHKKTNAMFLTENKRNVHPQNPS